MKGEKEAMAADFTIVCQPDGGTGKGGGNQRPEASDRRGNLKNDLLERLHNPTQLRLILTAAVLLIGYVAVYSPLEGHIAAAKRGLAETKKRLALRTKSRICESSLPRSKNGYPKRPT